MSAFLQPPVRFRRMSQKYREIQGYLPQTNALPEWARGDMDTRKPLEIPGKTAKPGVTKFRKVQLIASLEWTRADPTGTMAATPRISSHPVVGVSEGQGDCTIKPAGSMSLRQSSFLAHEETPPFNQLERAGKTPGVRKSLYP